VDCTHNAALAHPSIGVTSVFAGYEVISSTILVFKTGVSSDPAQAGSIPVRLRYQRLSSPLGPLHRQRMRAVGSIGDTAPLAT
jgi:hypothetical protein